MADDDVIRLFETVLTSPGDDRALARLKSRSRELLTCLDDSDDPRLLDVEALQPSWVIKVLDEIWGANELSDAEVANLSELVAITEECEGQIGIAFREALVRRLPDHLLVFERWFDGVPPVPSDEVDELLQTSVCKWAFPFSEVLATFGLTPLSFFYTTKAISNLVLDALRERSLDDFLILFSSNISRRALVEETADMTATELRTAERLLDWIVEVSARKPYVVPNLFIQHVDGSIAVRREASDADLFTLWSRVGGVQPVTSDHDEAGQAVRRNLAEAG